MKGGPCAEESNEQDAWDIEYNRWSKGEGGGTNERTINDRIECRKCNKRVRSGFRVEWIGL